MGKMFLLILPICVFTWLTTPSWAVNKVLALDGNGDYVAINDSPSLNIGGSVTLEAWVYPVKVKGWCQIVAKGDPVGGEDPYYLRVMPDKTKIEIEFGFWDPNSGKPKLWSVKSQIDSQVIIKRWSHIAGVLDAENHVMLLYLNGRQIASKSTEWQTGTNRNMPINIGAIHGTQLFEGFIDEVRIWNYARTQEEIQATMNITLNGDEPGLVGYWNFDDGTANDLSPNGNNGTLMGDAQIVISGFTATPKSGPPPLEVQFIPVSRADITSYLWDFGDGMTSDKANPIHVYQSKGTYTVSLAVTSDGETYTTTCENYIIVEDHGGVDNPSKITFDLPASGRIDLPGDIDAFKFHAKEGDIIILTVSAQNIGSSLNSYLRLWNPNGEQLAYNDNMSDTLDSYIGYQIPSDGEYIVEIGDTDGKGGADYFYSLLLRHGGQVAGTVGSTLSVSVPRRKNLTAWMYHGLKFECQNVNSGSTYRFSIFTSIDGQYGFFLPKGDYKVKVLFEDREWYYGGTEDEDQAAILKVEENKTIHVDFPLPLSRWGYVTRGLILGSLRDTAHTEDDIKEDFLKPVGGEAKVMPRAGDVFTFNGEDLRWTAYEFCPGLVLNQLFGGGHDTAYMVSYLKFKEGGEVDLWVVNDDDISIWINDQNIWIKSITEGWPHNRDKLKVEVKPGWNRLLVKVNNRGGAYWGFFIRFPNVRPVEISLNPDVMRLIGDVSGNGQITAFDAALILQFVVGIIDHLPAPSNLQVSSSPHIFSISLPDIAAHPGEEVRLPITIQDATGLVAGGMILEYNPDVIQAEDVLAGGLTSGTYWKANLSEEGVIRIAFAGDNEMSGGGTLFEIKMRAISEGDGEVKVERIYLFMDWGVKVESGEVKVIPEETVLLQNYPNPFNPETWIPFKLAENTRVEIGIYDISGRLVRRLNLGYLKAGSYVDRNEAARWDGRNEVGEKVSSGIYIYRMKVGARSFIKRMIISK